MSISKEQQESLVREIIRLIDENIDDPRILEIGQSLAVIVFGILSNEDQDDCSVGFSLQEYAYNCLHASQGDDSARAWLEANRRTLDAAIKEKFINDR